MKGNLVQKVIDTYPTMEELCNHEKTQTLFSIPTHKIDNKVGIISGLVHKMCNEMYGLGFYKSTFFTPSDDPYDFNTGKNIIGDGIIYDSQKRTHKVNYKEFIALSKVMFCSFLGIELNDEQYESYLDFKCDERIYKILD